MKRFSKRFEATLPKHPILALPNGGGQVRLRMAPGGLAPVRGATALKIERLHAKSGADFSLVLGNGGRPAQARRGRSFARLKAGLRRIGDSLQSRISSLGGRRTGTRLS